jgi:glycosyltransferase involved in cell wall biosynthesis
MKVAYIFAEEGRPVLRSTGHSVHIRELCNALLALGHDVLLLAGEIGTERSDTLRLPRMVELGPRRWSHRRPRVRELSSAQRSSTRRSIRRGLESSVVGAFARDVARILWWIARNEYFYRKCRRVLINDPPDFIYERYVAGSWIGARLASDLRVPLIVEMNASFTFPEEWWTRHTWVYTNSVRWVERRIAGRADNVVVISSHLRDYLLSLNIVAEKVSVMFNGADISRFRPDADGAEAVRRSYHLHGHLVVGFIGSLKPWHGVDLLLESAKDLAERGSPVRWLIVGDGPLLEWLQRRAEQEQLAELMRFVGYVPRDRAPAHVAAMDIAVSPVTVAGRSAIKIFEYMASGCAVVASRDPDTATIIRDHHNGLLVAPGSHEELRDAIIGLVDDSELRARLGVEARRTIEANFTWQRNATRVIEIAGAAMRPPFAPATE